MENKKNIGLILILTLAMFFVTTTATETASAASTKTYTATSIPWSQQITLLSPNTVVINYSPSKVGTKTFSIGSNKMHTGTVGKVEFAWSDNGKNWNTWTTTNFGYGKNAISQTLYSGNKNIRFRMTITTTSIMYVDATATIIDSVENIPVTLTVSPGSGKQGTTFTFSGNGYTANGAIDYHVRKPDNTEYPVTTLTASSSGVLSYKYKSTTASMVGTYNIWAIDRSTGRQSINVQETITAVPVTLTVSPGSGKQGTTFTFSGNGYTANGAIDYHVRKPDNTEYPVTTLTASSSGVLSYKYKSTTASMVGTYNIWAIDRSTGRQSNNVQETIKK